MEVVVIGAGVFGVWTALSLAQAGHRVSLLEREAAGHGRSSSSGESRIIRSAYGSDEIYTTLARRSLGLWADFFRQVNQPRLFRKTGVLWMAASNAPGIGEARAIFERLQIGHEWLNEHALGARYPQFVISPETVALFEPDAGALLAEASLQALMQAASRAGVIYERVAVKPPVMDSSRLSGVETLDGRRFTADQFVFACGSWLAKLFPVLAQVIRPTRQDLFFFETPGDAQSLQETGMPVWIDERDPHLAYGFPDLGKGIKLGFHQLGPDFDPDLPAQESTPAAIAEAANYLAERVVGMRGARLRATQVCHYENTPTGDLLIDLHPGTDNVWLVGGGSGHGFKHAPAVAEYVTNAIGRSSLRQPRFSLRAKQADRGRVL
jgi:sarcosine oxidase